LLPLALVWVLVYVVLVFVVQQYEGVTMVAAFVPGTVRLCSRVNVVKGCWIQNPLATVWPNYRFEEIQGGKREISLKGLSPKTRSPTAALVI
jgi:hypothetical protein